MNLLIVLFLFLLGIILGSFLNAMVFRIHARRKFWGNERSECDHCKHQLAAKDLIPVVSWLLLKGRCCYCKKKLSIEHPLVEVSAGVVFVLSYIYWPLDALTTQGLYSLALWLVISVGLMALAVYDLKWYLLPNKILYPTALVAGAGKLGYILLFSDQILHEVLMHLLAILVASGIFWLLFYGSKGKWIGFGDVRLGLITGTLLGSPLLSLLMIFGASLLGTLAVLPSLLAAKKGLNAKIPYGPFLIASTWLCLLFGQQIIDWYKSFLQV